MNFVAISGIGGGMRGRRGWHAQTGILLIVATLIVSAISAHVDVYSRPAPSSSVREPGWETSQILTEFACLAVAGLIPAAIAYLIASLRPDSMVCQATAALISNVVCAAVAYPYLAWISPGAPFFLGGLGAFFFGLALLGRFALKAQRAELRTTADADAASTA